MASIYILGTSLLFFVSAFMNEIPHGLRVWNLMNMTFVCSPLTHLSKYILKRTKLYSEARVTG